MMIEFLKDNQLDIMLFMSGICAILTCLALAMKTLSTKRRLILASLELVVMDKKLKASSLKKSNKKVAAIKVK